MNRPYQVGLLDDLHNYYPAILYDPDRFTNITSILNYIYSQNQYHFNIFNRNQQLYTQWQQPPQPPNYPPPNYPPPTHPQQPNRYPSPPRSQPHSQPRSPPLSQQSSQSTTTPSVVQRLASNPLTYYTHNTLPLFTFELDDYQYLTQQNISNNATSLIRELLRTYQVPTQESVLVTPTTEQINSATVLRQAVSNDEESDISCSICQDSYTEGQAIRTISHCNHSFHKSCIDPWFQRNVRCPVCRFDIRDHVTDQANV
jgi:hypothetical protein